MRLGNITGDTTARLKLVFVVALVLRLCAMCFFESYIFSPKNSFHNYGYNNARIAKHIVLGDGFKVGGGFDDSGVPYSTAITPPGYVYFIALVFYLFGIYSVKSAIVLEVIQSITAALTCIALYALGRRYSERVGLLAAIGLAIYPASIFFSVMRIGPVNLVILLLALIMVYLLRLRESLSSRDAIICGCLMGLDALFEPTVSLFYVAGCAWLFFWSSRSRLGAIRCCAIMTLVCMILITPWTIRNYVVFGRFVPIKAALGRNLLEGNIPSGTGVIHKFDFTGAFSDEEATEMKQLDAVETDDVLFKKAITFIKADPNRFLLSTIRRFYYFWSPINPYLRVKFDTLRIFTYGPALVLGIAGILLSWKKKWMETSLVLLLFVSYPFPFYFTHVSINRYKYIVEPFLVLLSGYALSSLLERFAGHSGTEPQIDSSSRKSFRQSGQPGIPS